MPNRYRMVTAVVVTSLLIGAESASAEPLALPSWTEIFSTSGEVRGQAAPRLGGPVFVGERFSAGRALERTVLSRPRRSSIAERDRVVTGRVAAAFDLGNVYALSQASANGDLHVYLASEHTFDTGTDSVIEYSLYRAAHQLRFDGARGRVLGHDVAGDLRVKVLVRDGTPRGVAIARRAGGKWRRIMRARFGASGCAGNRERALVCVKSLASGGPVASPRRGRGPDGAQVVLPAASRLLEMGLNLGVLVNQNAAVASIAVRTERDIVVGQLNAGQMRQPQRSIGRSNGRLAGGGS